ncbi:hypothetical protein V8J36_09515 [Frigidibacter sp. MR17.14]
MIAYQECDDIRGLRAGAVLESGWWVAPAALFGIWAWADLLLLLHHGF